MTNPSIGSRQDAGARGPATLGWCAAFAVLIVATRGVALAWEVLDWDESTYVLRAAQLIDGAFPSINLWNFRPPALIGALHLVLRVFGDSIVAVRGFGAACIWVAACFSFLLCRRFNGQMPAGIAVMSLICGLSAYELLSTSSEQFVIAFMAVALYLVCAWPGRLWSAFLVGLLLSVAALARLNLAYMIIVLGVYYALFLVRPRPDWHRGAVLAYGLGGLVPLGLLVLAYWLAGGLDRFLLFVFGILFDYAFDQLPFLDVLRAQAGNFLRFVGEAPMIYAPIVLGGVVGLGGMFRPPAMPAILVWAGAAMTASILTGGAPYAHYWVQLFPFVALLMARALARSTMRPLRLITLSLCAMAISSTALVQGAAAWRVAANWAEYRDDYVVRRAADWIAADRKNGDEVLALQAHLILWYLRDPPLSPAINHPGDITNRAIIGALVRAGLIAPDEFSRILARRPRYIVKLEGPIGYLVGTPEQELLAAALASGYAVQFRSGNIEVYRRD